MVNSKDYAQNSNEYYRPNIDEDDWTFGISLKQGTLPLYRFKNDILQESPQHTQYLRVGENYNQQPQTNNYIIPLFIFIGFVVVCFVGYNCIKKRNYTPRPYRRYGDHIVLMC